MIRDRYLAHAPRAVVATALLCLGSCSTGSTGPTEGLPAEPILPLRLITGSPVGFTDVEDPFIHAVPTSGEVTSAELASSFALAVSVGDHYALEITAGPVPSPGGGELVAVVSFESRPGGPRTTVLPVLEEGSAIDLGVVMREGEDAPSARNPLAEIDSDGNGTVDFDEPEPVAFVVLRVDPTDGERGVDVDEDVEIRFSVELDPASVSDASVRLLGPFGPERVALRLRGTGAGDRIRIEPEGRLEADADYRVQVEATLRTADGRTLEAPFEASFRTEPAGDGTPTDGEVDESDESDESEELPDDSSGPGDGDEGEDTSDETDEDESDEGEGDPDSGNSGPGGGGGDDSGDSSGPGSGGDGSDSDDVADEAADEADEAADEADEAADEADEGP